MGVPAHNWATVANCDRDDLDEVAQERNASASAPIWVNCDRDDLDEVAQSSCEFFRQPFTGRGLVQFSAKPPDQAKTGRPKTCS
jgi:hypothetical protein